MKRTVKTLWHTPRQTLARRVLFQVHLWLGVALGLYTVVIGLTGSALVFRTEMERAGSPQLYAVTETAQTAPLRGVVQSVAARWPAEPVEGIDNLGRAGLPEIVYTDARGGEQRMVYVDPRTGRILGSHLRFAGVLGVCANLHYYLLAGHTGYVVNGVCACAFLVLCLTGWVLWWPGRRGLHRALRVHWRARWRRLNWDLHAVGGFWTNPLLIAVVATGVLFVFPKPVLRLVAPAATVRNWLSTPRPSPGGAPQVNADTALAAARQALGPDRVVRYLALASPQFAMYDAIAYAPGTDDYAMPEYVYIDGHTGRVAAVHDARALPVGMRWATYAYAVHFGSFGGVATKAMWVLLGLLPAGLWATGLLLWWNRQGWGARRRAAGSTGVRRSL